MPMKTPQTKGKVLAETAEARRLAGVRDGAPWRRWGPYLSERQWGTVREDYSEHGNAWDYLPHDHARSRAYRWGEDGIAGFGDDQLYLCLGLALWNERDPILKERLFGLTNSEGDHGEDVKELYYYLDGTPSHSWMRMLYKYPQAEFPYARLVEETRRRGVDDPEFELLDTGAFDDDRYFDIAVTSAKAGHDDVLMEIVATNRGSEPAPLHILPQLWARNVWSWKPGVQKPLLRKVSGSDVVAIHPQLSTMRLICDDAPELLFCENESNSRRLWGSDAQGYFKDGINDFVVRARADAVNPEATGTKAAAHYRFLIAGGGSVRLRLRLRPEQAASGLDDFDDILACRRRRSRRILRGIASRCAGCRCTPCAASSAGWHALVKAVLLFRYSGVASRRPAAAESRRGPPVRPQRRVGASQQCRHRVDVGLQYPWYAAW